MQQVQCVTHQAQSPYLQPQQPQPIVHQNQISVVISPTNMPTIKAEPRKWGTGLFGCFQDISTCIGVMLCPFFYTFHLSSRAGESCFIPVLVPNSMVALRTKIRTQNRIQGSICDDCCKLTFCGPCALCQMGRELNRVVQV